MHRRQVSLLFSLLLSLSLVAVSCVDGTDDAGTDKTTTTATTGSDGGPIELGRGVTADTITIGYAYLDFDGLVKKGLSPAGWGDQKAAFQSVVDDINAKDGINGRTLKVIYEGYSPLGTEDAEAVCLRLTQDNEVFAVIGGFLGPAEPANTCIVGRQETILVGGVQSAERLSEAKAPWITDRPLRTRQTAVLMDLLKKKGRLKDASVAVVTNIDAEDVRGEVIAALGDAHVKPVEDLFSDAAVGDVIAEDQTWSTLAERIRASNANTVLLVGNPSAGIRNISSQGLDVDIWVLDQEALQNLGSTLDLKVADGALTAAPLAGQDLWDDDTVKVCRDAYSKAHPDVTIIEPNALAETDEDVPQGLIVGCRFLKLFEAVATKVGHNLNSTTFAAAVAKIGNFSIPGQPFASLGADKFDSNDSFRLVSFDSTISQDGGFKSLTDIMDVTP